MTGLRFHLFGGHQIARYMLVLLQGKFSARLCWTLELVEFNWTYFLSGLPFSFLSVLNPLYDWSINKAPTDARRRNKISPNFLFEHSVELDRTLNWFELVRVEMNICPIGRYCCLKVYKTLQIKQIVRLWNTDWYTKVYFEKAKNNRVINRAINGNIGNQKSENC